MILTSRSKDKLRLHKSQRSSKRTFIKLFSINYESELIAYGIKIDMLKLCWIKVIKNLVDIISQIWEAWVVKGVSRLKYFLNLDHLSSFCDMLELNSNSTISFCQWFCSKKKSPWVRYLFLNLRDYFIVEILVQSLHTELFHLRQEFNDDADRTIRVLELNLTRWHDLLLSFSLFYCLFKLNYKLEIFSNLSTELTN